MLNIGNAKHVGKRTLPQAGKGVYVADLHREGIEPYEAGAGNVASTQQHLCTHQLCYLCQISLYTLPNSHLGTLRSGSIGTPLEVWHDAVSISC